MQKFGNLLLGGLGAAGLCVLATTTSSASGQGGALVRLQAATPGLAQTGNYNVTGRGRMGSIQIPTGAVAGHYLVSDANGVGAWAAWNLPLPYTDSGVANNNVGLFQIINNGSNAAIEGRNDSGAFGRLGGDSYGAYGEHGTSFNRGSLGNSDTGASGSNNNNPSYGYLGGAANGAWGEHGATTGVGVRGRAYNTGGVNVGVYGTTNSPDGYGVLGTNLSAVTSAVGLRGEATTSTLGTGVEGAGSYQGGFFSGDRTGSTSYGIYAQGDGTGARGVFGYASGDGTKYGVRGNALGNGTNFGIYSLADLGTAGNKQFVIDHPQDPLNKYLKHYCQEGPLPINEYSGTVTTDEKGFATVKMPSYYQSINKNPRYLLTVIDDSEDFVLSKITRELTNGSFTLRTSKPNVKVTWVVKAERNDRWNQMYPPQTEVEKDGRERGRYQRPELYDAPAEMGMDINERAVKSKR